MQELYKRIKARREELDMSQDELAKLMGYKSRSSINKIEKGENDIPQSKIVALAEALHTTPAYLMGWTQEEPATTIDDGLSDDARKLVDIIHDFDRDEISAMNIAAQTLIALRKTQVR